MISEYHGHCECSAETEPAFLAIDHIFNDGAVERAARKMSGDAQAILEARPIKRDSRCARHLPEGHRRLGQVHLSPEAIEDICANEQLNADYLLRTGPTPDAFTFREPFDAPLARVYGLDLDQLPPGPDLSYSRTRYGNWDSGGH